MNELISILIPLLISVESNGNPNAVGDGGAAVGILQIHKTYWIDGCHYLGVNYPYSWARSPEKSKEIARAYLMRYGVAYQKKTGKKATLEILAALHCSGPNGWNKMDKPGVKQYIEKVKHLIEDRKD